MAHFYYNDSGLIKLVEKQGELMNSTSLAISLLSELHNGVFNSRIHDFDTLFLLMGDKCRVGITVIDSAYGQHIPPEIERYMLAEKVDIKYVFQPCSMEGISLDSYYVFNPGAISQKSDYFFWLKPENSLSRSWADCFINIENHFCQLAAHMMRRELRQRALLIDGPFRNLENTQAQLGDNTESLSMLDVIEKNFHRWSESGYITHSWEEQIDAYFTGRLVKQFVVSHRSNSGAIPMQKELMDKVVEIVKG